MRGSLFILGCCLALSSSKEIPNDIVRAVRQVSFPPSQVPSSNSQSFSQSGSGGFNAQTFSSSSSQGGCNCVPITQCSSNFIQAKGASICKLSDGNQGICCTDVKSSSAGPQRRVLGGVNKNVQMQDVSTRVLNSASQHGQQFVNNLNSVETGLRSAGVMIQKNSNTPSSQHLRHFKVNKEAKQLHRLALAIGSATQTMKNDLSLSSDQGAFGIQRFTAQNTLLRNQCPTNIGCRDPNSKYRTLDGTCNSLSNPEWGSRNTIAQRIAPPRYDDGVMTPRTRATDGSLLPNPRVTASTVFKAGDKPDRQHTLSVMQWGQFLDHDITHVPFPNMENGEGIECCPGGRVAQGNQRHPECFPIEIPQNDPFYGPRGRQCINLVRSMFAPRQGCTFGHAEQLNQISHWLDGSAVYGSDEEESHEVRSFRNGQLKTSAHNFLPLEQNPGADCQASSRNAACFVAGDSRVNEQPGLTTIHTIWMRQHNRAASFLQQLNPHWSDERVYQEARRIIVAQIQHITYNEWLPIIVGPDFMSVYDLTPQQSDYSTIYDGRIDPSINNEFLGAAFRFGHSIVQGLIRLFSQNGAASTIRLRDHFNSPHLLQRQPNRFDDMVRAFIQLSSQQFDTDVTEDLQNHLFQTPAVDFGMDLMSLNIQRGRDHGLGTYNDLRKICGFQRARTFNDLIHIPPQTRQLLARMYRSVDDIDLFVGGLSEVPVGGGLLGPVFICIVGDQFARLKLGDRYFYDYSPAINPGAFSLGQLNEIRKTSWSRVLCDNANIDNAQPLGFRLDVGNGINSQVPCGALPQVLLDRWQENQQFG